MRSASPHLVIERHAPRERGAIGVGCRVGVVSLDVDGSRAVLPHYDQERLLPAPTTDDVGAVEVVGAVTVVTCVDAFPHRTHPRVRAREPSLLNITSHVILNP